MLGNLFYPTQMIYSAAKGLAGGDCSKLQQGAEQGMPLRSCGMLQHLYSEGLEE